MLFMFMVADESEVDNTDYIFLKSYDYFVCHVRGEYRDAVSSEMTADIIPTAVNASSSHQWWPISDALHGEGCKEVF